MPRSAAGDETKITKKSCFASRPFSCADIFWHTPFIDIVWHMPFMENSTDVAQESESHIHALNHGTALARSSRVVYDDCANVRRNNIPLPNHRAPGKRGYGPGLPRGRHAAGPSSSAEVSL